MYIRIGIVDDHSIMCDAIRNVIEYNSSHSVIFQANGGRDFFDKLSNPDNNIDVLLLDINMPDMNGFEVLQKIRKENYRIKVIFVTADDNIELFLKAIGRNVDGYILKDACKNELIKAIEEVYLDNSYLQPKLLNRLNAKLMNQKFGETIFENLTNREMQIMEYVACGKINKEIAYDLEISEKTVKNHLTNIFRKLGVKDRTQAAIFAIQNEIVSI